MAIFAGIFALVFVGVCCLLAAYEESLSAEKRYGDDLTRWMWNYVGPLIAVGNFVLDLGGWIALVVRKASQRLQKRRLQE